MRFQLFTVPRARPFLRARSAFASVGVTWAGQRPFRQSGQPWSPHNHEGAIVRRNSRRLYIYTRTPCLSAASNRFRPTTPCPDRRYLGRLFLTGPKHHFLGGHTRRDRSANSALIKSSGKLSRRSFSASLSFSGFDGIGSLIRPHLGCKQKVSHPIGVSTAPINICRMLFELSN